MNDLIKLAETFGARLTCYESADNATVTVEFSADALTAFVSRIREEDAKLCDGQLIGTNKNDHVADRYYDKGCNDCAAAIRSAASTTSTPDR